MPNKHASIKHLRQTKVRAAKNLAVKNLLKKLVKTSRKHLTAKEKDKATTSVKAAIKALDKAASNRVISKNTAGRLKSRLMKQLHQLGK